jgi:cytochrome c oxidase assembly factor CtaG
MAALLGALIVFAHAGHWAVDALYLVPVIVLVVFALNGRRRERREARERGENAPD